VVSQSGSDKGSCQWPFWSWFLTLSLPKPRFGRRETSSLQGIAGQNSFSRTKRRGFEQHLMVINHQNVLALGGAEESLRPEAVKGRCRDRVSVRSDSRTGAGTFEIEKRQIAGSG
jgi:hypothetical protein